MSNFTIEQEKLQEIIIGEVKNALNEQIKVGINGVIYEIVSKKVEERLDGILKHGDNLERVVELVANTDLKQWIHVNLDEELLADCVKNGLIAQLSTLSREELLNILSAKPKVSVEDEMVDEIFGMLDHGRELIDKHNPHTHQVVDFIQGSLRDIFTKYKKEV